MPARLHQRLHLIDNPWTFPSAATIAQGTQV
jgi:hypothetical protein